MAPPENYDMIKSTDPYEGSSIESFLPLMQYNDVFIISAILKGLIDHVIWIQPTWLNDAELFIIQEFFIGLTKEATMKPLLCLCRTEKLNLDKKNKDYECYIMNRLHQLFKELNPEECHEIKQFTLLETTGHHLSKKIASKSYGDIFIDIDEDFFGVESGIQSLLDNEISSHTIEKIADEFSILFCPQTIKDEEILNKIIQNVFSHLATYRSFSKLYSYRKDFKRQSKSLVGKYLCVGTKEVEMKLIRFLDKIYEDKTLHIKEIKALAQTNYCLKNSPRLNTTIIFTLCHGNVLPESEDSEIFIPTNKDIIERGKTLEKILQEIYRYKVPNFYSIARSIRDGYTPRMKHSLIEKTILKSIENILAKYKTKTRIVYDQYLLFGKAGWKGNP